MQINEMVDKAHNLAKELGWWEKDGKAVTDLLPQDRLAIHMLIVTEIAEATEAVRSENLKTTELKTMEATELADAVLRIMDYFGFMGWDLEQTMLAKHMHNRTRALRHGGKII